MSNDLGHIAINLALNSEDFTKNIREVSSQLGNLNKAVRSTSSVLKEVPNDMKALEKQSKNLNTQSTLLTLKQKEYEKQLKLVQDAVAKTTDNGEDMSKMTITQRKELSRLSTELSKVEDDLTKNSVQQGKINSQIKDSVKLLNDEKNNLNGKSDALTNNNREMQKSIDKQDAYTKSIKESKDAIDKEADALELRNKKSEARTTIANTAASGMNTVGNGMLAVSGAAIAGGAYAVNKAMEVETANSAIYRVSDVEDEDKEAFADKLLKKFSESTFKSYSEFASIYEGMGAAGITDAASQDEGYDAIKNLALASSQNAETVTQLLTSSAGLLQFKEGDMTKYASALAAGGNAGSSTDAEVQAMAQELTGLTVQKVSNANIVALSSFWTSAGINAEAARSSSTSIFQQLKDADLSDSDGNGQTMATVAGLTNEQYSEMAKNDPTELFESFINGLAKINEAGGDVNATLGSLGFNSSIENSILMKSTAQASLFAGIQADVTSAYEQGTAASIEALAAEETTAAQLQQTLNNLMTQTIRIGNALLPVVDDLLVLMEPVFENIEKFAEWFGELNDEEKKFLVNMVAVVGATGLALKGLAGIITLTTTLKGGIMAITGAMSTLGLKTGITRTAMKTLVGTSDDVAVAMGSGVKSTALFNSALGTTSTSIGATTGLLSGLSGALITFGGISALAVGVSILLNELEKNIEYNKSDLKGYLDNLQPVLQNEVNQHRAIVLETEATLETTYNGTVNEEEVKAVKEQLATDAEAAYKIMDDAIARSGYEKTGDSAIDAELSAASDRRKAEIESARADYTTYNNEIIAIEEAALAQKRDLTFEEISLIEAKKKSMLDVLTIAQTDDSAARQNVRKAYGADLNYKDDKDLINKTVEETPGKIEDIKLELENTKARLDTDLKNQVISEEAYIKARDEATRIYEEKMNESALTYYNALEKQDKWFNPFDNDSLYEKTIAAESANLTTEDFNVLKGRKDFESKNTFDLGVTAEGAEKEGATLWNSFFTGLTDSEFETNPLKHLQNYIAGENGMEGIRDIIANTDITAEMQTMITEATVEAGKWNELTFDEKSLIIDDSKLLSIQQSMESTGLWDSFSSDEKLGVINSDEDTARNIALTNDNFKNLDTSSKSSILGKDVTKAEDDFITLNDLWDSADFMEQYLEIDSSDTEKAATEFNKLVDLVENHRISKTKIEVDTTQYHEGLNTVWESWNAMKENYMAYSFNLSLNDMLTSGLENTFDSVKLLWEGFKSWFENFRQGFKDFGVAIKDGWSDFTSAGKGSISTNSQYGIPQYAVGTGYHTGGLAILGDGGKAEPYLTPSGMFGISPNVDTLLDLPKGSQVWSSLSEFYKTLPHFATGTDASFLTSNKVANRQSAINLTVNMNAPNTTFTKENERSLIAAFNRENNRNNGQLTRARGGR